ncbi:hypothetical protein KIN20_011231 [Parelaphostrongylus tenuis]|uniref:Uncharacterized protein n=1 Tax=Parelaphostrongylus tenuis TaxID=148309 RepID=A0AAD5MZZ2_PARTN|nr:hypothetical protein KIN20_011231 [Parelaphostrongylus tenuis]
MKSLFYVALLSVANGKTIDRTIRVPDNDSTLHDLIYTKAVPESNNRIPDSMWWVPSGESYQATKSTALDGQRYYTTYQFRLMLQKSNCSRSVIRVPLPRQCSPIRSSRKVQCNVTLGWYESVPSSIEIETYCSRLFS